MLAFSRIPGNTFSFWIRQTLRWSRGRPDLPHEPKKDLFDYSHAPAELEARERVLRERYHLDALASTSTRGLYRKNLYLIDILEKAMEPSQNLALLSNEKKEIKALDVGSQDWHYVFGLERWLKHAGSEKGRRVVLKGVEVDGYGIYPDFRSRKDYAEAYLNQTGNSEATYEIGDFLNTSGTNLDIVTIFYPFVTRHHLLLWGLPLRYFQPDKFMEKLAGSIKIGGTLLVFTHTLKEHELFLEKGKTHGAFLLVKEGRALSQLVDFHESVSDRRFSVWERIPKPN